MINAFDASAGVFVRGLGHLRGCLAKGAAHAQETGRDPASLLQARLADDMNDLAVQAHWSAEGAKIAVARLLGLEGAAVPEPARTFDAIDARLEASIVTLGATSPEALASRLAIPIVMRFGADERTFSASQFLLEFAVPSFFFHTTTAYAILRAEGVPLQKGDFLGR